jgi:hypothetical protein
MSGIPLGIPPPWYLQHVKAKVTVTATTAKSGDGVQGFGWMNKESVPVSVSVTENIH